MASMGCSDGKAPGSITDTLTEPVTGMEMVLLPAGTFSMGSPPDEPGREPGETLHRVALSRPFYLGRHEMTQEQWARVMGDNPSQHSDCGTCPVENVSWHEAHDFLARLSARTGERFRLPTEAEWEYACRAGTTTAFATGPRLSPAQGNYDGRYRLPAAPGEPPTYDPEGLYREKTTPVGSFAANPWGLFDLHGNVWEWVEDDACPYDDAGASIEAPLEDPLGVCDPATSGGKKGIRGGSWYFGEDSARCALRYTHRPQDVGPSLGFRIVREVALQQVSKR
jgi:formylglycine-generating enzyme required for sulfatase activity